MKRYLVIVLMMSVFFLNGETIIINRNKTPLKSGPGAFFDNLIFLQINTQVANLGVATEDDGWFKVSFKGQVNNKNTEIIGYLSRLSVSQKKIANDPFSSLRNEAIGGEAKNQIAPGAYTAAIKGFLQNYSSTHASIRYSYDDVYQYVNFTYKDYLFYKKKTGLSYFPKYGELLGLSDTYITETMEMLSAAVVLENLSSHELVRSSDAIMLNVMANLLARQTIDYDKQYFVWVIKNTEPFAFSGPGGAIFITDSLIKLLTKEELVAVISHEVGHIAMRHGVRDLAMQQARANMKNQFDELEEVFDEKTASISSDLESIIDEALRAAALVRDDTQEFEADDIAIELLRRNRINRMNLKSALTKVYANLSSSQMNEYRLQTERRLKRIK